MGARGEARPEGRRFVGVVIAAAAVVLGLGLVSPAAAVRGLAAPSVDMRQADSGAVVVAGWAPRARGAVSIERRGGARWITLTRAHARAHRYAVTVRLAAGTVTALRVVSGGSVRRLSVQMPAARTTTPKPAAKPPKPTTDACGTQPLKADGSAWSCTFDDEFDGTTLDRTKWIPNTAFVTVSGDIHACYRDDPANVNVAGGSLNLTLVKLDAPAPCAVAASPTQYMAGSVSTYHLFSQQYGRFEARIKTAAASSPGLHEAFWLWPDDRSSTISWPDSGEIDVAESFSAYPSIVGSYLHYAADHVGLLYGTNAANCAANRGAWNTYTVDWGPSRIETFVNGKSCLVNTSADPAFQKRYIINLTQAIGGASWNQLTDATPVPATMQVDYVHVWK